jgi:hypothetical protein
VECRWLDEFALGDLVHAIDGSDSGQIVGQIHGQVLISEEEGEISITVVPRAICHIIANLDESLLETIAGRWAPEHVPLDVRRRVLREVKDLMKAAVSSDLVVFLEQSP